MQIVGFLVSHLKLYKSYDVMPHFIQILKFCQVLVQMFNVSIMRFVFFHVHVLGGRCANTVNHRHRFRLFIVSATDLSAKSFLLIFSSPEPLGSQGELIGWP